MNLRNELNGATCEDINTVKNQEVELVGDNGNAL